MSRISHNASPHTFPKTGLHTADVVTNVFATTTKEYQRERKASLSKRESPKTSYQRKRQGTHGRHPRVVPQRQSPPWHSLLVPSTSHCRKWSKPHNCAYNSVEPATWTRTTDHTQKSPLAIATRSKISTRTVQSDQWHLLCDVRE